MIAIESRSCCSFSIIILKPCPSLPRRFSAGTRQSSKKISLVSWAGRPSFSSFRPRTKPGVSASTRMRLTPLCAGLALGSVLTATMKRSPSWPIEMKVLAPFTT